MRSYTRSPAPHLRQHVIVVHVSNKHFKTVSVFSASVCVPVFVSCVVVVASLQPQFRRESLLVFVFIITKIRQVFDVFSTIVRFVLCPVLLLSSLQPQFAISPRIVVFIFLLLLAVLLSSSTPATVRHFADRSYLFFSCCLLCCCRVPLQPQFAISPAD